MGKALYREYRPKKLDDVVGQEHITTTLKNAIKKGVISHAYLFTGPRGVGKTSIARILAHEINGLPYTDESIHLDIIEIDAASNRRIDEIRDLRDKVHIAPTSAKYKVYIIDEVHMLTREAFNALLKTLEEPPEHVIFILATTEAHKVPETIISRTQRFSFKPIDEINTVAHLRSIADSEKISIDDDALSLLAEHGRGSFRDSISMLDQITSLGKEQINKQDVMTLLGIPSEQILDEIISAVANNSTQDIFSGVQKLQDQGIDSAQAARGISSKLRSLLISENSSLNHNTSILLLKSLLPLTLSSSDFLGLEIALLDAIKPISNDTRVKLAKPATKEVDVVVPVVKQPIKTETVVESLKVEPVKIKNPVEKPQKVLQSNDKSTETTNLDADSWSEMLQELKKNNNTLYGILRLAKPMLTDGQCVISFNFAFHKKQLENPANKKILQDLLKQYFKLSNFTTVVDKQASVTQQSTLPPQKSETVDAVASISNIFGGAELLES